MPRPTGVTPAPPAFDLEDLRERVGARLQAKERTIAAMPGGWAPDAREPITIDARTLFDAIDDSAALLAEVDRLAEINGQLAGALVAEMECNDRPERED